MSNGFTAPPERDFQSCSRLMADQATHLASLEQWSSSQCSNADGLEGLLSPLQSVVPWLAHPFTEKLVQCQRGMHDVSGKITLTGQDYARADQSSLAAVRGIYPSAIPSFPDIGALHLPNIGDFTDEPVSLKPPTSAEEDTTKNMKHNLLLFRSMLGNGPLGLAEKAFRLCTGQSLIVLLLDPLLGEYGRLKYLHDAYSELSDGAYTVAATVRKGSWALASEWTGDAATGFDSYMFRWSMGIGGIGDGAALISKAYLDGYNAVMPLADAALLAINSLMKGAIQQLAKLAAGDGAAELFGGGPEDPIADVIAGINTLYRIYEIVKIIITAVEEIIKIYDKIKTEIENIQSTVNKVIHFFEEPLPSIGSLINDVEQRGFSFEKDSGWNPELGVARIAMLPAA